MRYKWHADHKRIGNMTNERWENPWKLIAVGMALVIATVIVTGLVVANWGGRESDKKAVDVSPGRATPREATSPAAPTTPGVPTQSAIDACNQSAAAQAGQRENTKDTVIAGAIGAVAGAAVGSAAAPSLLAGAVPARGRSSVASWAPTRPACTRAATRDKGNLAGDEEQS
jgi:hypothetical protein